MIPFLLQFTKPPRLPTLADSEFECAIRATGNDDVLFIQGENIFVSDNVLDMEGFSLSE